MDLRLILSTLLFLLKCKGSKCLSEARSRFVVEAGSVTPTQGFLPHAHTCLMYRRA